jgi:GDP-L-fucose synthase
MEKDAIIYIANHEAMIGSALLSHLQRNGYRKLVTGSASDLNLTDQKAVNNFFQKVKPEYVILTSIKMGGILANNQFPAEFIYQNIQSQTNVIHAAWQNGIKKLLYLGSSCMYPKDCLQPIKEDYLLTGKLESTSEPYAIAKIAGTTMCKSYYRQYKANFISAIPADVYGPEDDFNPKTSHFLPGLIKRIHEAKLQNLDEVVVWGTGLPRRECLHVDDLADAIIFLMQEYDQPEVVNIGSGLDFSIKDIAFLLAGIIGFEGKITFDDSKPDGAYRKLLDNSKINQLGWSPKISVEKGIKQTYLWYQKQFAD